MATAPARAGVSIAAAAQRDRRHAGAPGRFDVYGLSPIMTASRGRSFPFFNAA